MCGSSMDISRKDLQNADRLLNLDLSLNIFILVGREPRETPVLEPILLVLYFYSGLFVFLRAV